MKRIFLLALVASMLACLVSDGQAFERARRGYGASTCWHGAYYDPAWGTPVALVVPPTASHQTHWAWGVGNTWITPIHPQFGRAYPGPLGAGGGYLPPPPWPSSTDQFGDNYVRGPW